jgi:hypothetical protein
LEARSLGSISINVQITALRKLAVEAADNGLLAPELAAGIARNQGLRSKGVRVGNWLWIRQAQELLTRRSRNQTGRQIEKLEPLAKCLHRPVDIERNEPR